MERRDFIKFGACAAATLTLLDSATALAKPGPILDAHIHLFDPLRTGGIPWPKQDDKVLYRRALPDRYSRISSEFGVVGAIAIEASPLASDNRWLLDVAAKNPVIVGVVGDLVPGTSSYLGELERLHANPLFLGFRYGNLWDRDLSVDLLNPGFMDGLKASAQAGLVFESANPDDNLIRAILTIAERVPDLRIVIDHLPNAKIPKDAKPREEYWANLHRLAQRPGVFVKLSEIPVVQDGRLVTDSEFYRPSLDQLWNLFGEDRVLFGSDWPNSDTTATFKETLSIVRNYMAEKGASAREKYFWRNSTAAYKWHRRTPNQPSV